MTKSKVLIATAAASLFTAGLATQAGAAHHEGDSGEKVKCEGANSCKAKGDCHTASNDCKGLNSCKGKSWVYLSAEECEKAKAEKGDG